MADDNSTPKLTQREMQETLEKQVAQMRREIAKINRALAEHAEEAEEEARRWYNGASERAAKATQVLRTQAHSVSETVRENPGTVSSALLLGGAVGFAIGCLLGQAMGSDTRRSWY